MDLEKLFKLASYTAIFCGFTALLVSGTFEVVESALFLAAMSVAWYLEGTRWRIPEKAGTALIVLVLPTFYLGWRFGFFGFASTEAVVAGVLSRVILSLTAIKLLQKKSDRDWIFLYLMSFFEVLLGAGLSISPSYLASIIAFVFSMVCVMILFEIRKAGRIVAHRGPLAAPMPEQRVLPAAYRIPVLAVFLVMGISAVVVPMFFLLPRVGGAGIGSSRGGIKASSGFSDSVRLGGIGRIQQNDAVVMRVRVENRRDADSFMRWRGVALDTFDNQSWSRSRSEAREPRPRGDRDVIQIDYASGRDSLTLQTVYLEPLDTPVLFGLTKIVGVQGEFPFLYRDSNGSVTFQRSGARVSYKVLSDTSLPSPERLRADNRPYARSESRFLQLPIELDSRIPVLAARTIRGTRNRYDAAKAVEAYLQNDFGYTLDQLAGGMDPLADFLFNVRKGHCEYFATAMAVMLRTQGIATRVVNGFQQGDYNNTADAYVVRQRHAHSWVEVYFPGEETWVPFDPTPFAGRDLGDHSTGLIAGFDRYLEAMQIVWIQYFVAFDDQEQRSLFTSIRRGISSYNTKASVWTDGLQRRFASWWREARGDKGFDVSVSAVASGIAYITAAILGFLMFVWLCRKIVKLKVWREIRRRVYGSSGASIVEFYDRMQAVLASKGLAREPFQTPLEFASALGMPEALKITEKYNRVRFGEEHLSTSDAEEIEGWLEEIASGGPRLKQKRS